MMNSVFRAYNGKTLSFNITLNIQALVCLYDLQNCLDTPLDNTMKLWTCI